MSATRVSVIIPTHNRSRSLLRTLESLSRQTCPRDQFEVVVVADGCSDDTAQVVARAQTPYRLLFFEQPGQGASAARNRGAQAAMGELFLFLDDDIEAWPGLVQAHLQGAGSQRAVIGYLPTVLEHQRGYFRVVLRTWWENMFAAMRAPGYRFRYTNLLTGNFSVAAQVFRQLGGFNVTLRCHEDYEFGYRLIRAGVEFVFEPRAGGYHHEQTRLQRSLDRKLEEGRADVAMARMYPELLPVMQLANLYTHGGRFWRRFYRLAFDAHWLGDHLARGLQASLPLFERLGLRGRWRHSLDRLLIYWYLRGVSDILGSHSAWSAFIQAMSKPGGQAAARVLQIDLSTGLEQAGKLLDEARPDEVRLCYGTQEIGTTWPLPGAEPLHSRHLGHILQEELGWWVMGTVFPAQSANQDGAHARLMADLFACWRKEADL